MYEDRQEAGRKLAEVLERYRGKDVVVLALPRGGIVLGAEVAKALKAPLDVVLVRKIGHPFGEEYAIGAVVLGEKPIYDDSEAAAADEAWLKRATASEQQVNEHRRELYYDDKFEPVPLKDKTVIIVDDGIATGLTMEAAVRAAQKQHPKQVIVAVPVTPPDSVERLRRLADEIVVLDDPEEFLSAVGAHYREFAQVDDSEVRSLLREHHK
jgi:putative phosphoribosyl transferase